MISEQISRLRKMQNKTQKDVSDYIGVSRAVVSDYERGRKKPSPDTLGKIATFFGVTTDYLLGRVGLQVLPVNNLLRFDNHLTITGF